MSDVEAENSILSRTYIRYSIAVVAVAVAFLFRDAAVHFLGHDLPSFIIFYPAVMLVATLCGLWPGILATGLAAVLAVYWIMPPRGSFAITNATDVITLVIFLGMGVFISLVAAAYRRNQKQVAAFARELSLRESQEQLRQSEKQFETLANAIPQLCWMANPDGWIFWYNQRWYGYTGTTPQQMEGWGWQSVHHPETLPKVLEQWKSSIATGEPFEMVFPIRGGDGVFRPFLTRGMPVKDSAGEVVRWFGTNTDIGEQKRIEEELRKSNERLDLAAEVAGLGEWEENLKDHTSNRSLRHAEIFGYPSAESEWSFKIYLSHVLPQYRAEVEEKVNSSLPSGGWDLETQIRRLDGEVRWIWARGRSVLDESGLPARMFGTVVDITARKQAEEVLRRQAEMLRLSFDAIIVWRLNGGIESWNHGATQLYGYNELEARGRITHDLLRTIHPEPWSSIEAKLHESGHWEGELRHFTKDGREVTVSARLQLIVGADGVQRILESNRDITERKQAEVAQAHLAAIVASSGDAIISRNPDGFISSWNKSAERLFSYSATEIVGQPISLIVPPERRGEDEAILKQVCLGETVDHFETIRLDKNGRKIEVSLTISPIRDDSGIIIGVSGSVRDITERKRAEEQLRQLNRTLKALSNSNHALLHASDESELLQQVCHIISEDCGHPLVWIGFAEDDENKTVRHVAHAGFDEGYLETLRITWDDSERGRGPTGTAIRSGQKSMCRNMNTDRAFVPWREHAIKRGYAASLAIPLAIDGKPFGAITIYSRVPDAFSEAEVNLLTELANDLSRGISVLRLRAAHAETQAKLQGIISSAMDAIISIDENQRIVVFNRAAEAVFQCAASEALGSTLDRFIPESLRNAHSELVRRFGIDGISARSMGSPGILAAIRSNGEEFPIEATISKADADGQKLYTVILRDVTERRKAEAALQASEQRWATTLRSIGDAVIATDATGEIEFMNEVAQQLTGWSMPEAQGNDLGTVFNIIQEVTRIKPESPVAKVLRSGMVVGLANHTALIRRDGTEIPIEDSGAPIRNKEGQIEGVVLVFHDVSEQRRGEKALRDSERLATTGRLAATIAHEIHNPLDAVGNLLYLIGLDARDDTSREYVAIASKELTRVTQLTQQMLTFQREAANPVPVKIGEILDNVVALFERKITSAGINLKRQVDFDGHILALPGELRQIFANLVGNAIEAVGPRHGSIAIRAYASWDWQRERAGLRVVVADDGPGIPAAVRNRIFEPFFTTKGEGGTGLGLWITADILRKYNATMRLRTRTHPSNPGTCFSVFFPFENSAD